MLLLIERPKCWRRCCWSKGQSVEDDVANRKVKVLKMILLIESSKCWRCCWSKGQSAENVAAYLRFKMLLIEVVKVLKMLLIERSKCWRCRWKIKMLKMLLMMKTKDWRWRLHDVEKLPMIYRCVTPLMLMMSPISALVVVDVEYPSR